MWRAKTHNLSQPLLKATTKAKVNRQPTRYLNLANLYFSTIFWFQNFFQVPNTNTILSKSKNPNPHKSVLQFDFSSLLSLYNAAAFYTWNHAVWILNSRGWWLCNYHNYIVEHTSSLFMHSPQAYLMFPFMLNQNLTLSLKVPVLGVM